MTLTRLQVLVPSDRPEAVASLPLRVIAAALGEDDLRASIGVRTSANRKATLQLVRTDGAPAGFAKIGWNASTDASVRTESAALAALGPGDSGSVRAPRRLAALEYAGHPVVVTAPLPLSVRAVRPGRDQPTAVELRDLAPVVRTDHVAAIGQVRALRERLGALVLPSVAEPADHARRLLAAVDAEDPKLAVGARWHGDLTPWNTARDADGTLWAWDWESAEPDAPVGLDALHWAFSIHRDESGGGGLHVDAFEAGAAQLLAAVGVLRAAWSSLLRIYLATTIERACRVAVEDGGWDRVWIQPQALTALSARVDACWSR